MTKSEDIMHDILLIITVALFIFMVVGVGVSSAPVSSETVIT